MTSIPLNLDSDGLLKIVKKAAEESNKKYKAVHHQLKRKKHISK